MMKKLLMFILCVILGEIALIGIDVSRYYISIHYTEPAKARMRTRLSNQQKNNPCIFTDDLDDPVRKLPECAALVKEMEEQ